MDKLIGCRSVGKPVHTILAWVACLLVARFVAIPLLERTVGRLVTELFGPVSFVQIFNIRTDEQSPGHSLDDDQTDLEHTFGERVL